jgi:hypothetical protein
MITDRYGHDSCLSVTSGPSIIPVLYDFSIATKLTISAISSISFPIKVSQKRQTPTPFILSIQVSLKGQVTQRPKSQVFSTTFTRSPKDGTSPRT